MHTDQAEHGETDGDPSHGGEGAVDAASTSRQRGNGDERVDGQKEGASAEGAVRGQPGDAWRHGRKCWGLGAESPSQATGRGYWDYRPGTSSTPALLTRC